VTGSAADRSRLCDGGRRVVFTSVAKVYPKFETPFVAIALTAVLEVVFVLLRPFEQLADAFVTAIVPFYALGVASIFVLRKRVGYDPPYWAPLFPVIPTFVCAGDGFPAGEDHRSGESDSDAGGVRGDSGGDAGVLQHSVLTCGTAPARSGAARSMSS
jgi:hypothetical protein